MSQNWDQNSNINWSKLNENEMKIGSKLDPNVANNRNKKWPEIEEKMVKIRNRKDRTVIG